MAKFDLSNLRIGWAERQEEPLQVETPQEVSTTSGSLNFTDKLTETWNSFDIQEQDFWTEEITSLPSFDIESQEGIDSEKVQRFIEHSESRGRTIEQIEESYKKGLKLWTFNTRTQEPTKEDTIFSEALGKAEENKPWFLQKLSAFWSSAFKDDKGVEKWQSFWRKRKPFKAVIQTEEEMEAEEGFTGFISESWEALSKRGANIADIKERFDVKTKEWNRKIQEAFEKWEKGQAFIESMKKSADQIGTSFQIVWQGAWVIGDLIWEWVENSIQEFTPEFIENTIESAVKWVSETKGVQKIAESYNEFRKNKPELARNIEATVNIAELIPWVKGLTSVIRGGWWETIKEVSKGVVEKVIEAWKKTVDKWGDVLDTAWENIWEVVGRKSKSLETRATEEIRNEAEEIALPTLQEMTKREKWGQFLNVIEEWGEKKLVRDSIDVVAIEKTAWLIDQGKITKDMTNIKKRNVIQSEIKSISDDIDVDLKKSDAKLTKDEMTGLIDDLTEKILENPVITWRVESVIKKLIPELRKWLTKNDYFPEDILKIRKDFDKSVKKAKWDKPFDTELENAFSTVLKDLRQGLNKQVWDMVPESNLRQKLDEQSALFKIVDTLESRFAAESETIFWKVLQKIESFGLPRTEIVETLTAVWLVTGWLLWAVSIPAVAWIWAIALWRRGVKWLTKASNKKRLASFLNKIDDSISKNPKKEEIKAFKKKIQELQKEKKLDELNVEQRLDKIQELFKAITPSSQLKLESGKPEVIVTPWTAEKGVIQESKKGLGDLKRPWTSSNISGTIDDFNDTLINASNVDEIDNVIDFLKESDVSITMQDKLIKNAELQKEILKEINNQGSIDIKIIQDEYWKDLLSSFNKLSWDEKRVIKTKSWDKFTKVEFLKTSNSKKFSDLAQWYLQERFWIDKTVQEVFEDLKDLIK